MASAELAATNRALALRNRLMRMVKQAELASRVKHRCCCQRSAVSGSSTALLSAGNWKNATAKTSTQQALCMAQALLTGVDLAGSQVLEEVETEDGSFALKAVVQEGKKFIQISQVLR